MTDVPDMELHKALHCSGGERLASAHPLAT